MQFHTSATLLIEILALIGLKGSYKNKIKNPNTALDTHAHAALL